MGGFRGVRSLEREHKTERRLSLPQRCCAKTSPKRCRGGFTVVVVVVVGVTTTVTLLCQNLTQKMLQVEVKRSPQNAATGSQSSPSVLLYSWIYFSQFPKHQVSFRSKQNVQKIFPFCGLTFFKSPSTIIIVTK